MRKIWVKKNVPDKKYWITARRNGYVYVAWVGYASGTVRGTRLSIKYTEEEFNSIFTLEKISGCYDERVVRKTEGQS